MAAGRSSVFCAAGLTAPLKKAPGETYRFGREPFLLFSFLTFRRKYLTTDCVRARRKCLITDCVQADGGIPSSPAKAAVSRQALCRIGLNFLYTRTVTTDTAVPFSRFMGTTANRARVDTLLMAGLIACPISMMDSSGSP